MHNLFGVIDILVSGARLWWIRSTFPGDPRFFASHPFSDPGRVILRQREVQWDVLWLLSASKGGWEHACWPHDSELCLHICIGSASENFESGRLPLGHESGGKHDDKANDPGRVHDQKEDVVITVHGHQLLAIVLRELANFIHPNGQDLPSQMLRVDHFDGVQHFLLLVRSVIHTLHHPLHARSHQHQVVLHRVARRALADKFLCLEVSRRREDHCVPVLCFGKAGYQNG
mmetsp:Transcript_104464/g.248550  ORF Transcript_104464/g.248550 Transcript_104464/m.248550 type:complete len:230 (-) Transcript_104464:360-1049(-)